MSHSPAESRHDPFAALRQRNFALAIGGRGASATANMVLSAAIFWQVYDISGSAFQLGMVGVARLIPSLGLGLLAGVVADSFDKRLISILSQLLMLACGAVLFEVTVSGDPGLSWLYGAAFLVALAGVFDSPARQAMLPQIVTRDAFANAITVQSTIQSLGFVTGPALAGFLIAARGPELAYAVFSGLLVVSIFTFFPMRLLPIDAPKRAVSLAAIREGIDYVRHRQVVLGAMTLDMFAVIFGGAAALLPVYAKDILDVGALGYGLLATSLDIGALGTSIVLVFFPPFRRPGVALLAAVAAFGLFTIVFGLSRSFPLSFAAYALIGVADQISVVMRQTMVQLATPDELRGRVTSVNFLFIGASNQLGAVESGMVAAVTNATFAVVSGGIGCLVVLGIVAAKLPELRTYRADLPNPGPSPAPGTPTPAVAALVGEAKASRE